MPSLIQVAYVTATILFIVGLHYLRAPATAPGGNILAALGMLIAIVATLLDQAILHYELIGWGLLVETLIGVLAARLVRMTAMPQMVGLFNGLGGGASALVAVGEYWRRLSASAGLTFETCLTIVLGALIGGVTLTGSLVTFGKLQELLPG
jgi:NAD(P) transhydrogenase subunit beta